MQWNSPKSNPNIQTPNVYVNPKFEIPQFSNLGLQILKKMSNLKPTTLLDRFPHLKTSRIDVVPFGHSKLQKTPKITFEQL